MIASIIRSFLARAKRPKALSPLPGVRIDNGLAPDNFYEAQTPLGAAIVQRHWDKLITSLQNQHRVFMIPSLTPGTVHWEDSDPYLSYGMRFHRRTHTLRIKHNHWRHDTVADAEAWEFASAKDLAAFVASLPENGLRPINYEEMFGKDGLAEMNRLLARNAALTALEAA
jgi:hypothetical protein